MNKVVLALAAAVALTPAVARAHCDTLDGPVVRTAQTALESGKLSPVLAWVQPGDEGQIRDAFVKARAARKAGNDAREVADRWFLETVVRVHRAGEGAPFTGLKPAGLPVDPAVAAVDQAVQSGDMTKVERLLTQAVHEGLAKRSSALAKEKPPAEDVAAGRRWVAAYVPLVHWAEGVRAAAAGAAEAHGAEQEASRDHNPAAQTEQPGPHAHGR